MTPVFVAAVKHDHLTSEGVQSLTAVKFVYEDAVYRVFLTADQAESLAAQLLMVAASVEPGLVG